MSQSTTNSKQTPNNQDYIFDTCIFNQILDSKIEIDFSANKAKYFVTHIQRDELNNTKEPNRKSNLLKIFEIVHPENDGAILTETMVWDTSNWDEAKFTKNEIPTSTFALGSSKLGKGKAELGTGGKYNSLLELLDEDKPNDHPNNVKDALIGETAIANKLTLVTDDTSLRNRTNELGGTAISFDEYVQKLDVKKT